ncbi:MAG TPA: squalene synthase HpnC, partial [Delftia acidovorans]|nr:squalene synthase HpnC [Delftia acidovorans]
MKSTAPTLPASPAPVTHYENFPVASWLCPPRLRPPIAALYHFARTADDLADEGDATPPERLAALAAYRADLMALGTEGEASMLART